MLPKSVYLWLVFINGLSSEPLVHSLTWPLRLAENDHAVAKIEWRNEKLTLNLAFTDPKEKKRKKTKHSLCTQFWNLFNLDSVNAHWGAWVLRSHKKITDDAWWSQKNWSCVGSLSISYNLGGHRYLEKSYSLASPFISVAALLPSLIMNSHLISICDLLYCIISYLSITCKKQNKN